MRITKLSQLANLRNFDKMFNPEKITDKVCEALAKEGQKVIRRAYLNRNWKNRTYNLYNSYVSAVIVHGKIRSMMFLGPERATKIHMREDGTVSGSNDVALQGIDVSGRKEAIAFVKAYAEQHKKKQITLVVAATMFYAGILESRGYRVLADMATSLEEIKSAGLHLTDFKLGSIFPESGPDAEVMIDPKYIALRNPEMDYDSPKARIFKTNMK